MSWQVQSTQSNVNYKTAGTSSDISSFGSGIFGDMLVVIAALDNSQTGGGDTTTVTSVTEPQGNTFVKAREQSIGGAVGGGACLAIWYANVVTPLNGADQITVHHESVTARVIGVALFRPSNANGGTLDATSVGSGTAADPAFLTLSGTQGIREYLWIYGLASEGPNTDTDTADTAGGWSLTSHGGTVGGGAASNMYQASGSQITSAGNSISVDWSHTANDYVQILAAFVENPVPPSGEPYRAQLVRVGFDLARRGPVLLVPQLFEIQPPGAGIVSAGSISARGVGRATAAPTVISAAAMPTPVHLPKIGIGARPIVGPPILREQEPGRVVSAAAITDAGSITARDAGRATAAGLDVVRGTATARDAGRATANATVVEQSAATARDAGRATAAGSSTFPQPQVGSAATRPLGAGIRSGLPFGPPVLRSQEPGELTLLTVVSSETIAGRSRARTTSTSTVVVRATASAREHARSTAVATDVVSGAGSGRDHARATAVGIDVVSGSAGAREHARATADSVVVATAYEQSRPALRILGVGARGIAGIGPPILREQEPGVVVYTWFGQASAFDHARATAAAANVVLAVATARNHARATAVGTDVVRGTATGRNHARATAVGTNVVQGAASGRQHAFSTASAFRAVVEAIVQTPRVLAAGFGRVGPPILREQEPGALTLTNVVSAGTITARNRARAAAAATDVVQGSAAGREHARSAVSALVVVRAVASGRDHARATESATVSVLAAAAGRMDSRTAVVAILFTLQVDAIVQAPLLSRPGINRVGGPPILVEQTSAIVALAAATATARNRSRATASAAVVEQASAVARQASRATASAAVVSAIAPPVSAPLLTAGIGRRIGPPLLREQEPGASILISVVSASATSRNHARATAAATVTTSATASAREHARATAVGRDVVQGRATARNRPRATLPCLVIERGSASPRGRGRATSRSLALVLGRAHAREHAYARAIGSTTFLLPTSVSIQAIADDGLRLIGVPEPSGALVGVGGPTLTLEAAADTTIALDAVADSGVDLPTPEEANAWDEGFDEGFGMSEESAFDVSFSDEEFG